jgi:8-oxo-dGTP pyrophosphatase MutT (NUDIX family)
MVLQVGVKIFLRNEDGRYLLLKRNNEKYKNTKGSWDIVGGRIEPGTNLIENLKREVYEETQLEIISEPRLLHAQDILHVPGKHTVRLTYIADAKGEVHLDTTENLEYMWLTVDEMKALGDIDVYAKEVLEKTWFSLSFVLV